MRIAIVHDAVRDSDAADAQDAVVQAGAVKEALFSLGHTAEIMACTLNLEQMAQRLKDFQTDLVFNLAESLQGQGRLIHLLPFCLDALGISYTGASAESMLLTSHKIMAKNHMLVNDLPTAQWIGPYPESVYGFSCNAHSSDAKTGKWIIKSVWEHASIGLDESGLVQGLSADEILSVLKKRASHMGGACFAERFIEGREFNLSVLASAQGAQVLSPAEIIFQDYGPDKVRIVDYKAKWDPKSFEFHHTPRSFDFKEQDRELIEHLKNLAIRCWKVFGLSGYARVDFRVDEAGNPWILEVNANPCLSPDAGFAAALEQSRISFAEAVRRILEDV